VGALSTPKNKTVEQFTEQARIPKADETFMQPGVLIGVPVSGALGCTAKNAHKTDA
jgi:hypothetical protein